MKYRIVATNNDLLPYKIQRKNEKSFFSIWRKVTKCKRYHEALTFVRDATERNSKNPAGTVVLEYDESDLVVEKLRNQEKQGRGEQAEMNVTSAMAMSGISPMVSKAYIEKLAGLK
jgi:hypothetical protein